MPGMEGLPPKKINIPEKPLREEVFIPHVNAMAKEFERHFGKEIKREDTEALKEILNSYFEQRIKRTDKFSSEKQGASFVYTSVDPGELANVLYEHYTGRKAEVMQTDNEGKSPKEREFMFVGGIINTSAGNEYALHEEILHKIISDLPRALEDIKNKREPLQKEYYTLGTPTNELGEVSDKFIEKCKENGASAELGKLYAEFIESKMEHTEGQGGGNISLYGVSMGSSMALETAKKMLEDGVVNQNPQEKEHPKLHLRIDMPIGQSDKPRKLWRIKLGSVYEATRVAITNPYLRSVMLDDKAFQKSKNSVLTKKGIVPHMSPEEKTIKEKIIKSLMEDLSTGIPIPEDIRVTEVIGLSDPLMNTKEVKNTLEQKAQTGQGADSLGESIASDKTRPNRRTFGINMSHSIPDLRENEFRRLLKAARTLEGIKN